MIGREEREEQKEEEIKRKELKELKERKRIKRIILWVIILFSIRRFLILGYTAPYSLPYLYLNPFIPSKLTPLKTAPTLK